MHNVFEDVVPISLFCIELIDVDLMLPPIVYTLYLCVTIVWFLTYCLSSVIFP